MTTPIVNVALHLARMAAADPDRPAVHFPPRGVNPDGPTAYDTLTFAQLHADSDALAHGLSAAGITRGTRTVLMVPPSLDFFSLTFALFKVAAVPVLIDPGMGVKNLGTCLAEAEPEAFVGIAKAHLARRLLRWGRQTIRTTVNVGRRRFFCDTSVPRLRAAGAGRGPFPVPDVSADDTAAVLFTSGSTGVAKGVVYPHGVFAAQVEMLKTTYGIEPGEVDLCTFPLFALFGPALGMTCVIPDMDFTRPATIDVRKAVAQIGRFGVTNMFGSPAVIRAFGAFAPLSPSGRGVGGEGTAPTLAGSDTGRGVVPSPGREARPPSPQRGEGNNLPPALPTLRRVISAGAPASAPALERFTKLLPDGVQVFTPYGATESLPVANIGSGEILAETRHLTDQGKGVCVGRPVAGMTVYVVTITDDAIPEWDESRCLPAGEIGEFVVRGPVVTKAYFHRPEATRLAKIRDPKTGDILHRMGDVGYLDETGRLWYCGRKSHRVVTPHGTLFTEQVEAVFNTVPEVSRTALVGVTRGGVTYPVVCVEGDGPTKRATVGAILGGGGRLMQEFKIALDLEGAGRAFSHTQSISTFLFHPAFPVDIRHNSKIFREKLAAWANRQLGSKWRPEPAAVPQPVPAGGRP